MIGKYQGSFSELALLVGLSALGQPETPDALTLGRLFQPKDPKGVLKA